MKKEFLKDFGAFVERQKHAKTKDEVIIRASAGKDLRYSPHFLVVPYMVYNAPKINKTDAMVYAAIYWFSEMGMKRCFASNDYIASVVKVKKSTVISSLDRLESAGCIERIFRDGTKRHRLEIIPLIEPNPTH